MQRKIPLDAAQMVHSQNFMYQHPLPLSRYEGDDNRFPEWSRWRLCEDGVEVGTPHSTGADIESIGTGFYSHWYNYLNFSSSDNSDPRSNGRTYTLENPDAWPIPSFLGIAILRGQRAGVRAGTFLLGVFGLLAVRCLAWVLYLPQLLSSAGRGFDRRDFAQFYGDMLELPVPVSPTVFPAYFYQYLDREYFRRVKIEDPSLEIAVAEGETSIKFLNYPFTTGTEFFYDGLKHLADRIPHQEFVYFDLNHPETLPAEAYQTVVMIHSVDDFNSPETMRVFRAFEHLTAPGGDVYFSGFTKKYIDDFWPWHLHRRMGGEQSFLEYRKLHPENLLDEETARKLCAAAGFEVVAYHELACDPAFIATYNAEIYFQKKSPVAAWKSVLWRIAPLRAAHVFCNTWLARAMFGAEMRARRSGRRGIGFFCHARKEAA